MARKRSAAQPPELAPPVAGAPLWEPAWFGAVAVAEMAAWRCVESQTDITTLKLVRTRDEHEALEAMLDASKPPAPEGWQGLHYLLYTPFRYSSPHGSRFRRGGEHGVWYGADSVEAVCAEVAYWRMRFIEDSDGLLQSGAELLTTHTIFQATVSGPSVDLTQPPWQAREAVWTHPTDYSGTQALAAEARVQGVAWIRYASVRQPGAHCAAALSLAALQNTRPSGEQHWGCRATRERVIFYSRDTGSSFSWER